MSSAKPRIPDLCRAVAGPDRAADHLRAGQAIIKALALIAGRPGIGPETTVMLSRLLRERLEESELAGLAYAALTACEPDKAWIVATTRLEGHEGAGPPEPPAWIGEMDPAWIMDDAMGWARAATPFQRRAYAMACLSHMDEEERHAIVRALDGRTA